MTMTKTLKRGLTAAVLVTGLAATPLLAQGRGGPFGPHGHRGFESGFALGALGLSDDQKTQIRSVVSGHRDEFRALAERSRKAREAERAAIEAIPVNEQQVRAASSEVAAAEADMAVLRARVHEQVFSVLTPDQQAKAKQLASERAARRAERRAEFEKRLQERQQQKAQEGAQAPK
jgi:periplasmic protein CpxP/Spy